MRLLVGWLFRFLLACAALALAATLAWQYVLAHYGHAWSHAPADARWVLSPRARQLMAEAFPKKADQFVLDAHVRLRSRGQLSGKDFKNQSYQPPNATLLRHPLAFVHERLVERAAGITTAKTHDGDYIARLVAQTKAMPGSYKARIFARDWVFDETGQRRPDESRSVVTNRYVRWVADQAPNHLIPVISIHPQRLDAASRIRERARAGIKTMVWRPVAQHIDLASPAARRVYSVLAKQHVTLVLPIGQCEAGNRRSRWMAPSAIKPILAAGVKVAVTLAGTRGARGQRLMPALFKLLASASNSNQLQVDLTDTMTRERARRVLQPLLAHPQYYKYYRYASGYPVTAENRAINLDRLASDGFIEPSLKKPLAAIRRVNPMAFVLVLMRHVHLPHTKLRLPKHVFIGQR